MQVLKPITTVELFRSPAFESSGVALKSSGDGQAVGQPAGPSAPYVRVLLPLLQEWAEGKAAAAARTHAQTPEQQQQQHWQQLAQQGQAGLQMPRTTCVDDLGCLQALHFLQRLRLSPEVEAQCLHFRALIWDTDAELGARAGGRTALESAGGGATPESAGGGAAPESAGAQEAEGSEAVSRQRG